MAVDELPSNVNVPPLALKFEAPLVSVKLPATVIIPVGAVTVELPETVKAPLKSAVLYEPISKVPAPFTVNCAAAITPEKPLNEPVAGLKVKVPLVVVMVPDPLKVPSTVIPLLKVGSVPTGKLHVLFTVLVPAVCVNDTELKLAELQVNVALPVPSKLIVPELCVNGAPAPIENVEAKVMFVDDAVKDIAVELKVNVPSTSNVSAPATKLPPENVNAPVV